MPDLIQIADKKRVADFIERLTPLLESFCRNGLAIARELADAERSLAPKDFITLCQHFRINYSTGRKLVKVGRSERIKAHEDKLRSVDAWSTLHEIEKLSDEQFEQFQADYLSGDKPVSLQRSDVEQFRASTLAKLQSHRLLARIEVDEDKLAEPEEMMAIRDELEEFVISLGTRFPAIRISFTDLAGRFEAKLEAENTKAIKQEVDAALKAARTRLRQVVDAEIAKMSGPDKKGQFLRRCGFEWGEIFGRQINPNRMLREFGEEPVQPHLVDNQFDDPCAEVGTRATLSEEDQVLLEELRARLREDDW